MIIDKIVIDGATYRAVTIEQAYEIGATEKDIADAIERQNPAPTESEIRTNAKNKIDQAAGDARSAVAGTHGDLIDLEYKLTEAQASQWDADGRPSSSVPESVSAWAMAANMTNDEACEDILDKSKQWTAGIMKIRSARLAANSKVASCPIDEVNQVVNGFISEVRSFFKG